MHVITNDGINTRYLLPKHLQSPYCVFVLKLAVFHESPIVMKELRAPQLIDLLGQLVFGIFNCTWRQNPTMTIPRIRLDNNGASIKMPGTDGLHQLFRLHIPSMFLSGIGAV
jgi:hypothetical protein